MALSVASRQVHAENGELESFLADQLYEQGIRGPEANQISQPPYSEVREPTARAAWHLCAYKDVFQPLELCRAPFFKGSACIVLSF